MVKRQLLMWVVLVCGVVAASQVVFVLFFREPTVEEAAEQITPGMTTAEVAGILRRPADSRYYGLVRLDDEDGDILIWCGDKQTLSVAFNREGVVLRSWLADLNRRDLPESRYVPTCCWPFR